MITIHRYILIIFLPLLLAGGCGGKESPEKGNHPAAQRIVSLSPSITKMIIDLGSEHRLAGVTSFHPPLKKAVPVIGTLVNPAVESILQARPDLVLLSEEDGATQKSDLIRATGLRLEMLGRHRNFKDITDNYRRLALLLGREKTALEKLALYEKRLAALRAEVKRVKEVTLLLATRPLVTVSSGSFINAMIQDGGGRNSFHGLITAYPVITLEALVKKNPPVLMVMQKGGKKELERMLNRFPATALKKRNIFEILPDTVAYYTPEDYIRGVATIRSILGAAR